MLSRITLMMGMAPPTEASNRICRPSWSARSNRAAPRFASSCLFAVTTSRPERRAPSTNVKAHSVPPMSSTTIETEGSSSTRWKSLVNRSAGASIPARLKSFSTMYATAGRPRWRRGWRRAPSGSPHRRSTRWSRSPAGRYSRSSRLLPSCAPLPPPTRVADADAPPGPRSSRVLRSPAPARRSPAARPGRGLPL